MENEWRYEESLEGFENLLTTYRELLDRAEIVVSRCYGKTFTADRFDPDSLTANNTVDVYGYDAWDERDGHTIPVAALYYTEEELQEYAQQMELKRQQEHEARLKQEEQRELERDRAEYERLKAKFEANSQ